MGRRDASNVCYRKNCFANLHKLGSEPECICLEDTNFGNRDCPFFKTKEQHSNDKARAAKFNRDRGIVEVRYR